MLVHVHLLLQLKVLKEESSFKGSESYCFFLHLKFNKWHKCLSKDVLDLSFFNRKRRVQHKIPKHFK